METPTPVSALLHAGIVNAGGFLLLRFADLMASAPAVSLVIAAIGALTAVIGSAIMISQTSIKSALAYSTVGQMGFMMLQCGLGAYSAAVVHLVGHSLYKAHAFLSSGDVVRRIRQEDWRRGSTPTGIAQGVITLGLITTLYAGAAWLLGYHWYSDAVVLAFGMVLMMGLWLYIDTPAPGLRPRLHLAVRASGIALAYFIVQRAAAWAFTDILPAPPAPGPAGTMILATLVGACLALALLQGRHLDSPAWRRLRVHLARGLYINVMVNRWLGAFRAVPQR